MSMVVATALVSGVAFAQAPSGRRFEWTTKSPEAKKLLLEIQSRIENFQGGAPSLDLEKKIAAADPDFAMGTYYLSVVTPDPVEGLKLYEMSREQAKRVSAGERRFIEGMVHVRVNQGLDFRRSIEPLEALAADYPGERLVHMILGQLYNGDGKWDQARAEFEKAQAIGPRSARAEAFLAGDALLKGRYADARAAYQAVEKSLPKGCAVRHPLRHDLQLSVREQRGQSTRVAAHLSRRVQGRRPGPAVSRGVRLERHGPHQPGERAPRGCDEGYDKGYESVPGSSIPDDQKQTWLGRLRHGKCRTLARMGRHQEAWAEAEAVKKMIVDGGDAARQYWQAWHYLAGYAKLEAGDAPAAVEHLLQADPNDPFHTLLLARAYDKIGKAAEAKKSLQKVVDSQWPGIERPLAFPEAKRKLQSL